MSTECCTCYDGGCRACVNAEKRRQRELIQKARDAAYEDAALTIEAFAETRLPNFWTVLREAARQVRALKATDTKAAPMPKRSIT